MKFYFCEGCGRRLDENDISSGKARNKKLKGVYCDACAVGVTTMDTLPLSENEAKQIVKEDAQRPSDKQTAGPGRPRDRRRTSGIQRAPSGRHDSSGPRASSRQRPAPPQRAGAGIPLMALGGGGLLVLALAALWLFARSPATSSSPRVAKKPGRMPSPVGNKETRKEEDNILSADPSEVERADAQVAEAKKTDVPETKPGSEKAKSPDPEATATEKPAQPPTAQPEQPPAKVDSTKPEANPPLNAKKESPADPGPILDGYVSRVLESLRSGELKTASTVVDDALKTQKLTKIQDDIAQLKPALAYLERLDADRRKALKGLKGKSVRLDTTKGERKGTVVSAGFEGIRLQVRYKINNRWQNGPELTIKLGDLTPKAWKMIFSPPAPGTPEEWIGRTLRELAQGHPTEAEKALEKCGNGQLAESLARNIARSKRERLDREARETWTRAEELLESKKWKAAEEAYQAFLQKYPDTATAKEFGQRATERLMALETRNRDLSPGLLGLYISDFWRNHRKRIDPHIAFSTKGKIHPDIRDSHFKVFWFGHIRIPRAGRYSFQCATGRTDHVWVTVDGKKVFSRRKLETPQSDTVDLKEGYHSAYIRYSHSYAETKCRLSWSLEGGFDWQPVPKEVLFHEAGPQGAEARHLGHLKPVGLEVAQKDDYYLPRYDKRTDVQIIPRKAPGASATYDLGGAFDRFAATVKVSKPKTQQAVPFVFQAFADGRLLWRSKPIVHPDTQTLRLPIPGVNRLKVQILCPKNPEALFGIWRNAVVWRSAEAP